MDERAQLESALEKNDRDRSRLQEELDEATTNHADLQDRMRQLDSQIDNLETSRRSMDSDYRQLAEQIRTLENDIGEVEERKERCKTRLNTLQAVEKKCSLVQQEIDELAARMAAEESNLVREALSTAIEGKRKTLSELRSPSKNDGRDRERHATGFARVRACGCGGANPHCGNCFGRGEY